MKKYILSIIFAVSVFTINAQSFNGVSISGDLPTAIAKFKEKGFTFSKYVDNGAILKGKIASYPIELYIFTTPKTKQVFKMVAYMDEQASWSSLKSDYDRMVEIFLQKYGETKYSDAKFISPYYLGDGYELQAVDQEKTSFYHLWLDVQGMNLVVEISKYKQVKLAYENVKMMEVKKRESSQIESNSF